MALQSIEARNREELKQAFTAMMREGPSALLMTADTVHQRLIDKILTFASKNRLPAMHQLRDHVERGGLMSYGASFPDLFRHAAIYVDRFSRARSPPISLSSCPPHSRLFINMKSAKALGLTIPPSLLLRADQVID